MPEVKISALPAAGALDGTETFPVVQGGVTKKLPSALLATQAELDAHLHTGTYGALGVLANEPVLYVSKSSKASDANDGLSPGTAKATVAGARAIAVNGTTIQLGVGTFDTAGLSLLGLTACKVKGLGEGVSVLRGTTSAAVLELDGYYHRLENLTIDGNAKLSVTGLMVRGYSAATPSYVSVRHLRVQNVVVKSCKEGVRLGHYSTLNGVNGDLGDADITGNRFDSIWIDACDYGWIEDGQNILENEVANLITTGITFHHVFQPRGGYFNVDTWDAGDTLTAGYPKVEVTSGGNVTIKRCRSEHSTVAATFIHTTNATTNVLIAQSELTTKGGLTNEVVCNYAGGNVIHEHATIDGVVALTDTDFAAIGRAPLGGYTRTGNQNTKFEAIFDPGAPRTTKLHVGQPPTATPTPAAPMTVGDGTTDALNLIGSAATTSLNWFTLGSAVRRALIQMVLVGTNGGKLVFYSKADGGGLTEAFSLDGAQLATFANGLSVATTAVGVRGLFVNAVTGATADLATLQLAGVTKAKIRSDGAVFFTGSLQATTANEPYLAVGTNKLSVEQRTAATDKFEINVDLFAVRGSTAVAKPSVTGSRGGNAALASLLTALANQGFITDSTT